MAIYEEPDPDGTEKISRFGCGTLLGIFVGIGLAVRFDFSSIGLLAAVMTGAILVCGYLALKYGDEFWLSLKGWW